MTRIRWAPVIARAAEIVTAYDTGVTLRQLFYRLVSAQLIPNTDTSYKRLSSLTADGRRAGTFPELLDRGRTIYRHGTFADPADALEALEASYRLDRTRGQDVSLYLGVEKNGLVEQLRTWFGDRGFPVLALGGYASQSYVREVVTDVERLARPAVLLYAGDHDPSGEDIDRDWIARTGCWAKVVRVALSAEQVTRYDLPVNTGKAADSRSAGFVARHGALRQVEVDALPPETLRALFTEAIAPFWDVSLYSSTLDQEERDVSELREVRDRFGGWSG